MPDAASTDQINEFSWVVLTRPVEQDGVTFYSGHVGVVMHVYPDGMAYEVEIGTRQLSVVVLTVEKDALALWRPSDA